MKVAVCITEARFSDTDTNCCARSGWGRMTCLVQGSAELRLHRVIK